MNKDKIMKNADILYSVANVVEKVLLAGLVLIIIGAIAMFFVPKGSWMAQSTVISFGNVSLELNEGVLPSQQVQTTRIVIGLAAAAVIVAVTFAGMRIIKNILRPMKEGAPFEGSVSADIRKLGTLVFWGGLIGQIAAYVTSILLVHNYVDLMSLFKEGAVKSVTTNFSFSLAFLFAALILYLLSYVFEYGQQLQKESDETL